MVGKVSPWIAPDAADAALRLDSEAALQQELAWAAHLSLQAVMLPALSPTEGNANYARLVGQVGASTSATHILLYVQERFRGCHLQRHMLVEPALLARHDAHGPCDM